MELGDIPAMRERGEISSNVTDGEAMAAANDIRNSIVYQAIANKLLGWQNPIEMAGIHE